MGEPHVSIVIPTYNRRRVVVDAIQSALAQTIQDFELIVVDDGSTDGTTEAVRSLGDERIRYVWQENQGVSAARNTGIGITESAIVAFLDSDNRWLPEHLDVVTSALGRFPGAVLATTCPCCDTDGTHGPGRTRLIDPLRPVMTENFVGFPNCVAIRRGALQAMGGFDERLSVMEGSELYIRLATRGAFAVGVPKHPPG